MGTTLEAVNMLVTLMGTANNMIASAGQISQILATAQAQGRTQLTPEEWAVVQGADDAARQQLVDAIAKALKG